MNTAATIPSKDAAARRATLMVYLWLAMLSLPIFFLGLGAGEPVIEAEARCLEINQSMVATNDLLIPRLDGHPHLTKPPLFHWIAYGIAKISGGASLFSIRAASALGAVAMVLLVCAMGRAWFDEKTGWWAALICLTTFGTLEFAHRGMFDTILTAFVCLTIFAYSRWRTSGRKLDLVLIAIGLAGGFMTKGFMAWIVPLLPVAWDCWRRRPDRRTWVGLVAAIVLSLPLSLAWYAFLWFGSPEAREILISVVTVNFGHNSSGYEMAVHKEPLWFYLYALPMILLPWLPLAIRLVPRSWKGRGELTTEQQLCWIWLLGGVIFLTLVPAKADRYLLPLVPAWALLAGRCLARWERRDARWAMFAGGFYIAAGLGLPIWLWIRLGESAIIGLIVSGTLIVAGILCLKTRDILHIRQLAWIAILIMTLMLPLYYGRWHPAHRYLSKHHQSPEYQEYKNRKKRLSSLFHLATVEFWREKEPRILK